MAFKVFFLLILFRFASSELPHMRNCDPEEKRDTPTLCSNYENIRHVYAEKKELKKRFDKLNDDIEDLKESVENNTLTLGRLEKKLEKSLDGLTRSMEKQMGDISKLQDKVSKLEKQKDGMVGNFSDFEKRLNDTEMQLLEKKAKLENLEMETEAAFNNTNNLLKLYKKELSLLKSTAGDLAVNIEAQLNNTKEDLEDNLEKVHKETKALNSKLHHQKSEFDRKLESRFNKVINELKTQNLTMNHLNSQTAEKLEILEAETVAALNSTKTLLRLQMDEVSQLNSTTRGLQVKLEAQLNVTEVEINHKLDTIQSEFKVQNKVAFSASIASSHSFIGHVSFHTRKIVKFDKVFTNIGNAYNKKTGIFTAPVKGVYLFSFMTFGYNIYTSGAILVKNGKYQVSTWKSKGSDTSDTTSNSVILEMNAGDCANIILWRGGKIYTSVFSGFLIFPLV